MANHGFITTKKNLTAAKVRQDLQEINERRFKGLLKIEDSQWGNKGAWFISYEDSDDIFYKGFNIWLTSQRKIEHRHTHNYASYLELVFAEELGAKYNGIMSDEGVSNRWKPEPEKYSSYQAWLKIRYEHSIRYWPDAAEKMIKMEMKYVPKALKGC